MKVYGCKNGKLSANDLREITGVIDDGGLIVYPSETVYGIGADIFNESAMKKVFLAKHRPFDMPLSVGVADKRMAAKIADIDENAEKLIDMFMPGPLTIIVRKNENVPDIVTSNSQKVGIRIPDHPAAMQIMRKTGPIVATSANLHSRPDPVRMEEAKRDLGDAVAAYIDDGPCPLGKPSTIIWLMDGEVEIIRQGAITKKQIEDVLRC
ncbi:MAG: threonylcarbamoyl-AMP synthase [Methanomassiliicoccaceae archaeon]|jgi:L-threonylcarbamoyladenylate synthase|nr:threonylcarbamoyl-AMP synthase [Methanomassiliicoccaceae archaeon]